jgi:hypothetical protein
VAVTNPDVRLILANGLRRRRLGVKLRADAQRLELPFACPCFSLAWARKNTARAADIGIAGLFIVEIAPLVIDHDRFSACLAGMVMFRCSGRLD